MKMAIFVETDRAMAEALCDDYIQQNKIASFTITKGGPVTEFTFAKMSSDVAHGAGSPVSFSVTDKTDGVLYVLILMYA